MVSMAGLRTGSGGETATPASFVLAWQARQTQTSRRADWIEATMRRYEVPSAVDLVKRTDAVDRLSRLLDL
jgi:hypothetical protein